MKSALILLSFLFLSFFELIISTRNLSGNEEYSSLDDTLKYYKYSGEKLKKLLKDENIYVIDTRSFEKSAAGYIPNTILCPLSMLSFLYSVVEVGSEVIIITEIEEKQTAIDEFIELFAYKLLGYSIFSEVVENNNFELQVVEYNPNLNENIQEIVDNGEYIIDIRENNEIIQTGYIKQAKLLPLSTFLNDYDKIPKNGNVFIFCRSGARSIIGMTFLKREGYTNRFVVMKGGMNRVIEEGYPLVQILKK